MKRIAFIGTGMMGKPMAANLLTAGFAVSVYNRTPEKLRELVQQGATAAASISEAVQGAEAAILMVSDNDTVRQLVLGPQGVLEGASPGLVIIDMSTVTPEVNRELAAEAAGKGVAFLDAPVTGSVKQATEGTLIIMVGGEQTVYEQCLPVLQAMGKRIIHVGALGAGNHLKLCNNLVIGAIIAGVAESLVLAEKGGVDRKQVLDILGAGVLQSPWFHMKAPVLLNPDAPAAFALKHLTKDLGYAMEEGRKLAVALPVTAAGKENFIAAMNQGLGELDMAAIVRWVAQAGGLKM